MSTDTPRFKVGDTVVASTDSNYGRENYGVSVFQAGDVGEVIALTDLPGAETYLIRWTRQREVITDGEWYAFEHEVDSYEG